MAKVGRKGKYTSDLPIRVEDYARQGMRDEDIAKKIGVHVCTFYEYRNRFPEFDKAVKKGRQPVDFKVENALLKKALGYSYTEITHEYRLEDGKQKLVGKKRVRKHMPASEVAQIFWLKNRRPDGWKSDKNIEVNFNSTVIKQIKDQTRDLTEAEVVTKAQEIMSQYKQIEGKNTSNSKSGK